MNPLDILLVSAYPPGLHQYGIEKALRARGHRVFTAGAATTAMLRELEAAIQSYDPGYRYDLIVPADEPLPAILARVPFEPDLLLYLESGVPCLPPGLEDAPCPVIGLLTEDLLHAHWYSAIYPYFDLGLCTWKSTETAWRAQGYDHVRQWYYGARPAFSRDLGLPRIHDVAFLGNLNPRVQRKRLPAIQKILRLRDEGVAVYVGGRLFFEDYNRVYAQSKIVYHQGISDQVNMRVLEAMGAGCLVIMRRPQDPADPTTHFFRDGEDVVYCDSDEQALEQIRYYLAHEDERTRIAAAGHRKVHAEHNYEDAVRRLFTDVLPALPADLGTARRERLARFGKDERRRRLDYAYFYLSLGALDAADRQLLALPGLAGDAEALNLRGTLLAIGGQTDAALEHLGRACALAPAAPLPRVNRATVAIVAERPEAERFCGEALGVLGAADPATAPAAAFEGPVFPVGYDRFGAELAQTYVTAAPGAARHTALARLYRYRLHHAMGRLRMRRQAWAGGLADLDAAVLALPDDGYLRYDRALAAGAVGRSETILTDLADAVRLEPFFFQAQQDLALALDAAGRRDEAWAQMWDLVTHNPLVAVDADVLVKAADLALAVDRRREAVTLLERATAQKPDDPTLAARLAGLRDTRATVIMVVDRDARVAQRSIQTLCEETAESDADLVVIVPPEARALQAFLRVVDRAITVVPGTNDFATDVERAATTAAGSHLVILDGALVVEPGWLPPLLAAADDQTVTMPTVRGQGPTVRASFCASRALWDTVGGLAVGDDPAALEALGDRLVAAGVTVRRIAESVALVIPTLEGTGPRAGATPVPASLEGTGPRAGATPVPASALPAGAALISRGLRHVPTPPAEYFDFERPEVVALVPKDARRILDVGCGGGALGGLIKRERPGAEVWGIEAHPEAVAKARTRLDRVVSADLDALGGSDALGAAPGYFDCIICADVLEHLMDPERTLAALLPALAPGGSIVASIPNVRHQDVVLDLLINGRWQYQWAGILDATHLRFFTLAEIAGLLDRLGLRAEQLEPVASDEDPRLAPIADVVGQLGGDRARFVRESRIIQYVLRARPAARAPAPVVEAARRPKASIIVLAWNQLPYTRECVASVQRCTREPYELILVDNGSTDGTLPFFRSVPGAKVVANGANLGFAAGNNRGLDVATGDFVCILNNDTLVTDGWLDGMIACAGQDPRIGIVGPMSNCVSGPQQIGGATYDSFEALQRYAAEFRGSRRGRRMPLDRIVGFCMLITRAALEKIGRLDETFGVGNFEDDDYCLRARRAGFRLVVAADVFIHHFGSRTFAGEGVDWHAAMKHGEQVFREKWSGNGHATGATAALGSGHAG